LQAVLVAELLVGGKSLTFTGVDYPASIEGFLEGGDPAGSAAMAQDVRTCICISIHPYDLLDYSSSPSPAPDHHHEFRNST
jgi:hypothetical protein